MLFEKSIGICELCLILFLRCNVRDTQSAEPRVLQAFTFPCVFLVSLKVTSSIPSALLGCTPLLRYVVHCNFVDLNISYCSIVDYILIISWKTCCKTRYGILGSQWVVARLVVASLFNWLQFKVEVGGSDS